MRSAHVALLAAPVLLLAAACSTGTTPAISTDGLQSQLSEKIAADLGVTSDQVTVTCDGGVEGTVGATQRCAVTGPPGEANATVTVDSVDGTDINISYVFDK